FPRFTPARVPFFGVVAEELIRTCARSRHQRERFHELIRRPRLFLGIEAIPPGQSIIEYYSMPFVLGPGARFGGGHHGAALVRREPAEPEPGRSADLHSAKFNMLPSVVESAYCLAHGVQHTSIIGAHCEQDPSWSILKSLQREAFRIRFFFAGRLN